ncbi:hypothetical protein CRUP_024815 [Coryphaenoides rupestris]|nr:hypothetical protein CRUP_024815 [Coryphaenoides rupestris]
MDTSWSNFLFQTPPAQNQPEAELLPELSGSAPIKPLSKAGRPTHICATCNKQFKNSYNLRRHQSVHTGVRMKDRMAREKGAVPLSLLHLTLPPPAPAAPQPPPQPAPRSNQEAQPITNPPPHMAPAGSQVRKNHACEACGKAFRDVYHLNRHRLSHSDEKPYSCPICQQRFKRKDRMSYHVRSHQGAPDHLNSHVRQVHSTERPFKCTEKVPCHICGKLLSAAYITDHMRVHNQSQHHACHLCNRSFTTLTYLRVHAQKHHGQEWKESGAARGGGVLLCQLCGVQCKTATQLQGHMGTHATPPPPAPPPITTTTPTTTTTTSSSTSSRAGGGGGATATVGGTSMTVTTVTSGNSVALLVSDCSGIHTAAHS